MSEIWSTVADISAARIRAVRVAASAIALVGGHKEEILGDLADRLQKREAVLYRYTGTALQQVYEGPGSIAVLADNEESWYAVRSHIHPSGAGSTYHLLQSSDYGVNWQDGNRIPGASIEQLLSAGPGDLYALGSGRTFCYSRDGGCSWTPLTLHPDCDWVTERLVQLPDGRLGLAGRGVVAFDLATKTWDRIVPKQIGVYDIHSGWMIARHHDLTKIEKLGNQIIGEPTPFRPSSLPLRLAVSKRTFRVLTRAKDPALGPRVSLFRSDDSGCNWTETRLDLSGVADVAGECAGVGVSWSGEELLWASCG